MTRAETIGVIELLRRAYPRFAEPSPWETDVKKALSGMVDLWADMLADLSAQDVLPAVRQYIATAKFAPTIAEIRGLVAAPKFTPGDVWQEAYSLLNAGIPADQPEAAYTRMSEVCKAATLAVGGWYALSMAPEGDRRTERDFLAAAHAHIARPTPTHDTHTPAHLPASPAHLQAHPRVAPAHTHDAHTRDAAAIGGDGDG